ncbi:MAG: TonB-dependent receptor [Bryobacteraceae bacterium]|jgi:outer membrane receptor protein involved in Fe transport
MRRKISDVSAFCLFFPAFLSAAQFKGTVIDPSGAPIAGAQVSVVRRVGVEAQTASSISGAFELNAPETPGAKLVVTAPGFSTQTLPLEREVSVRLEIAPQVDSVRVVGSAMGVPASEQGGSVNVISGQEIRERNQALAIDMLREVPGLAFSQTGATGGLAGLFIRGGYATDNLVEIDGVPVNAFGGNFDFAHIPAEALDRVEVISGPQSAIYGEYANSGAINFVTREPDSPLAIDVLAEGGSNYERRFGISGAGLVAGFGIAASASRLDTDGPVTNGGYRNEDLLLNITRHFRRQMLALHGDFDSNQVGEPGPWGSDPKDTFTGIDTVSRSKNNFSDYLAHYQADLWDRVREDLFGTFFLNNNGYQSPYGFSLNRDLRAQGEARTIVSVTRHYTVAVGVSDGLEEVQNSYITDADYLTFPIRRRDTAVYLENRLEVGGHLFLSAGVRGEFIHTASIPTDGYSRPFFPAQTISRANPKLAAAYVLGRTRWHSSFGTGIRPPAGFDLAFTNNPALQPERTRSIDAGVEQKLFHDRLALDGTYFYNRFYDLIVTLGGSLSQLGLYQTGNVANSRAQGAEFAVKLRPARWIFVTGWYTLLKSEILSLNGSVNLAPAPFQVGQELLRRPANSGAVVAAFTRGKVTADVTGYFRGSVLDVEPAQGATNGLYQNPGYANVGININYALGRGLTAYGNLRNALNQHYEEVFGYPSLRLNFVAGMKWTLAKGR